MTTIKVKFHHSDDGNCRSVFESVGTEKKRYFARFDSGEWYTVYPASGYWEPDSRVRPNVVFKIVGESGKGKVLFTESNGDPVKTFISCNAKAKEIAEEFKEIIIHLKDYEEWKSWMLDAQSACGDKDYVENWLYCRATKEGTITLTKYRHLGLQFAVIRESYRHNISHQRYLVFSVVQILPDDDFQPCAAIIGYCFDVTDKGEPA